MKPNKLKLNSEWELKWGKEEISSIASIYSNGNYRISSSRSRSLATTFTVRTGGDKSKLYNTNLLLIFYSNLKHRKKSVARKTNVCLSLECQIQTNQSAINISTFYLLLECTVFSIHFLFSVLQVLCGSKRKETNYHFYSASVFVCFFLFCLLNKLCSIFIQAYAIVFIIHYEWFILQIFNIE